MRNLLHSRRGSAAFATVIALVPLIGVVALGGEAGSWYVTKQHAQNAADAAAYSGGLRLACELAGSVLQRYSNCSDSGLSRQGICLSKRILQRGDSTAYPGRACSATLPAGTSQSVAIDIGNSRLPPHGRRQLTAPSLGPPSAKPNRHIWRRCSA